VNQITFLATNRGLSVGSYRIWVNDLSQYLEECKIKCNIVSDPNTAFRNESEIVICSKSDAVYATGLKRANKKIGVINLAADSGLRPDFVIVGSIEEKVSLSHHKNVYLYPLIEKMYQDDNDYKEHIEKDSIRVGFHGSYSHLGKFDFGLKQALELYDQKYNLELLVITSNPFFNWQIGKPRIKNVTVKPWSFNAAKEDILSCDVGVVPNITKIDVSSQTHSLSADLGCYKTDYALRYKNKSNAGRNFVFHQLGIPVIADLTPSNLHILGNPDCGFVAQNTESWYKALIELRDVSKRQQVANSAKKEFDRLYNPVQWARRLYNNIKEI